MNPRYSYDFELFLFTVFSNNSFLSKLIKAIESLAVLKNPNSLILNKIESFFKELIWFIVSNFSTFSKYL